jgi:hypothetical protein
LRLPFRLKVDELRAIVNSRPLPFVTLIGSVVVLDIGSVVGDDVLEDVEVFEWGVSEMSPTAPTITTKSAIVAMALVPIAECAFKCDGGLDSVCLGVFLIARINTSTIPSPNTQAKTDTCLSWCIPNQ